LNDGSGIDLLATLVPPEKPGQRQFGVLLKWQFAPVTATKGNEALLAHGRWRTAIGSGPFPFPVVVFFFTMQDDGAWYSWVAEPLVEGEQAKLRLQTEPDCRLLTDDALEAVLDRVDAWHDAHYASLAAVTPGRKRPNKRA
jgi:hypothetical protein